MLYDEDLFKDEDLWEMHYTTNNTKIHCLYVIHSDSLPPARINSFHTKAYMNHIKDHLRKLLWNQPYQKDFYYNTY